MSPSCSPPPPCTHSLSCSPLPLMSPLTCHPHIPPHSLTHPLPSPPVAPRGPAPTPAPPRPPTHRWGRWDRWDRSVLSNWTCTPSGRQSRTHTGPVRGGGWMRLAETSLMIKRTADDRDAAVAMRCSAVVCCLLQLSYIALLSCIALHPSTKCHPPPSLPQVSPAPPTPCPAPRVRWRPCLTWAGCSTGQHTCTGCPRGSPHPPRRERVGVHTAVDLITINSSACCLQ